MKMKLKSRKGEKRKKSGNKQERKSIIEKLLNVEMEQDWTNVKRNEVKEWEEMRVKENKWKEKMN
jgi:hypothetical protein